MIATAVATLTAGQPFAFETVTGEGRQATYRGIRNGVIRYTLMEAPRFVGRVAVTELASVQPLHFS